MKEWIQNKYLNWRNNKVISSECWNLDNTILDFLIPRLKYLRANTIGHPPDLDYNEWLQILTEMIVGFEVAKDLMGMPELENIKYSTTETMKIGSLEVPKLNEEDLKVFHELQEDRLAKANNALELFRDRFFDLWW